MILINTPLAGESSRENYLSIVAMDSGNFKILQTQTLPEAVFLVVC
jgi:hypothetical protein